MMPGDFVAIVVEWDQPYVTGAPNSGGATSAIDLCITGAVGNDIVDNDNLNAASCSGANGIGKDPYQVMIIDNPANASGNSSQETLNIQVGLVSGTVPGRIKVAIEGDGLPLTINQFATNSPTIQGHPGAAGAAAVGAAFFLNTPACGTTPATLESYSSSGGDPILFDVTGTRLAAPVIRQKPDFVAPDGGNDTFLGFTLASGDITDNSTIAACENNANYPNFFGTSAATPHAASIAALLLQANSALTPTQIYTTLQQSALAMGAVPNYSSGYGFVQANAAYTMAPGAVPSAPTLILGETSVTVGSSTSLTWSSTNTTGCTASGTWTGAVASNGTQTITPTATGSDVYSLLCSNPTGSSTVTSVTLTVTAQVAPAAPTLTLGASSVTVGGSTTLTWSSVSSTSCTASGSWSGTLATSGSQTITPAAAGSDTYSLSCANATGSSPATSVTLTVNAASSGGGGGGALGLTTLLGLAGMCLMRLGRSRVRRGIVSHLAMARG